MEEASTSTEEDTCSESEEEVHQNEHEHGATTIFVGSLPYNTDEDELAAFFKEAGEVTEVRLARHSIKYDRRLRPKGYGHVEFASEIAAKKALEMNQQKFKGRNLKLELANPKHSSLPHSRMEKSSYEKEGGNACQTIFGKAFHKHLGEHEANQNEHGVTTIFELANPKGSSIPHSRMEKSSYKKEGGNARQTISSKAFHKHPEENEANQNEHGVTTIFAGNLPFNTDEDELAAFFKEAREVTEVRLARTKYDRRPKGYGHVEFASEVAAKKALEMNQHEFKGRELKLELANPKGPSIPQSRMEKSSYKKEGGNACQTISDKTFHKHHEENEENQNEHGATTIFVGNLPFDTDEDELAAFFKEAGEVTEARLARTKYDRRPKGYGHVEFASEIAAKKALEMIQKEFKGRELKLELANSKGSSIPHSRMVKPRYGKEGGNACQTNSGKAFHKHLEENEVLVAPVAVPEDMSGKTGKREAEEALEEALSSKRQKIETEVENVNTPTLMEEASPRTEEDACSDSEEETKTAVRNRNEHGSTTLFVGNLLFQANEDEIAAFFERAGEVIQVRLPRYKDDRSRGFAHVEFATEEAAKKALQMNQRLFQGRQLRLDLATPKCRENSLSYEKGRKFLGKTVFVKGFDKSLGKDQIRCKLQEHFGSCGGIARVSILTDPCGDITGKAFVDFKDADALSKAFELNGSDLDGNSLTVEMKRDSCDAGGRRNRTGSRDGQFSGGRGGKGHNRRSHSGRGGTPKKQHASTEDSGKEKQKAIIKLPKTM